MCASSNWEAAGAATWRIACAACRVRICALANQACFSRPDASYRGRFDPSSRKAAIGCRDASWLQLPNRAPPISWVSQGAQPNERRPEFPADLRPSNGTGPRDHGECFRNCAAAMAGQAPNGGFVNGVARGQGSARSGPDLQSFAKSAAKKCEPRPCRALAFFLTDESGKPRRAADGHSRIRMLACAGCRRVACLVAIHRCV